MKNSILIVMVGLMAQMTFAQKMDAKELAEYQNKLMFEQLDLSEGQQEKIVQHNVLFSEKQAALINREGSMFGKIAEVRKLKKEKNAELERILSKDQMEIFEDEIEPKVRSYMRRKMKQ